MQSNWEYSMSSEVDVHIGQQIRKRRIELGLTQNELALACGVRFQAMSKYETANCRMSAKRLWQFADVLEVPISYFYEGLEREKPIDETDSAPASIQELVEAISVLKERPQRKLLELARAMAAA